jgi:flavin-dependent dehydrogenase
VSLALEAGAALVTGVDVVQASMAGQRSEGVTLTARDGRRFDADVVIAADGVNSVVARRLGLHAGWKAASIALDMMEETPRTVLRDVEPSTLWVAYGYDPAPRTGPPGGAPASEGYAYVFPKRDHVNVGIGYVLQHYRDHIEAAPYDLQRGLVDHLRARGVVSGDSVRANFTPFLIPVGGPLRRPGRGRVLLAGDAGGFVNGVTAEGIYYAMVTGELAARAVIESGASRRLAARYRRACRREIGAELRDSVFLQRYLFADRRRIAQVVNGAAREREMTGLFLDFAVGRLTYSRLRRRLLRESPRLLGEFVRERFVPRLWSKPDRRRMGTPGA